MIFNFYINKLKFVILTYLTEYDNIATVDIAMLTNFIREHRTSNVLNY